jgi:hypothetical protein
LCSCHARAILLVMSPVASLPLPHHADETVVIRPALPEDARALERLAQLDSAVRPLAGAILVAEVAGELRAARSLQDGRTIADPFQPTAGLLSLLETRAALLRRAAGPVRTRATGILRRRTPARAAVR